MLSLDPLAFGRKGTPSLWPANTHVHPGRLWRTRSLKEPCTEGSLVFDLQDKCKAWHLPSRGRDSTHFTTHDGVGRA